MRIGPLNRQVALQRKQETQDETGGVTVDWIPIATVWSSIKHPSGLETVRSEVPVSVVKASIRIRFREDIDATCRALYRGKVYDIKAVLPDTVGREYVDLSCEEGQNDG